VANGPADEARVGLDRPAFLVLGLGRPHEVGSKQRSDEARDQQREEYRECHRESELLEILAGDPSHEAYRNEHGDDGGGGGHDRQTDLVGRLQRGVIGRLSVPHVPDDVLDLDDGVVNENAGDDGDGEQRDEVQREAGGTHGPERRNDRQRQGDGGDDGGAQVAQEQEDDEDGEGCTFKQRLHGGFVGADGVVDGVVDAFDAGVRIVGGEARDFPGNGS